MKFFYQTMLVLSSVFLFSCHQISDRKLRCYENPLKTTDSTELYIADPFIYKAGGLYYLTGTTIAGRRRICLLYFFRPD